MCWKAFIIIIITIIVIVNIIIIIIITVIINDIIIVMLQGPLLANYSQSFIEQLRTASSPYAYSTGAAKRRLSFSHESRLQSFIMWLSLTFKRGVPLGAAAAQRRQKSAVSCCPSAGISLFSPTTVT